MKKPKMRVARSVTIPTNKAIPIVASVTEKKMVLLRMGDDVIETSKSNLSQKIINMMEKAGIDVEYFNVPCLKGKESINGIPVNVRPMNSVSYESGAIVKVFESSNLSSENTNKFLQILFNNGIDWERECRISEETVCLLKMKV